MKIVILNVGYTSYFCACWRALARRTDVELKVFAPQTGVPYSYDVSEGLSIEILSEKDRADYGSLARRVLDEKPDVIILSGWMTKWANPMLTDKRFAKIRFLPFIDTSWMASLRQLLARFALHRFVKNVDGVIVAGERGRLFARWIGFENEKIFISAYGIDTTLFASAQMPERRVKSFLYVARYDPAKGMDTMLAAYGKYRSLVSDPWPLNCYGWGGSNELLRKAEGVNEMGFAQPRNLPEIFSNNGVYLLPSRYEPWGVSLAEAATAGMPLVCSHMVTSGVDVVRHLYNGLVFTAGDVDSLTRCLLWCHVHHDRLAQMGSLSRTYGLAYSAEAWAERIAWAAECVLAQK